MTLTTNEDDKLWPLRRMNITSTDGMKARVLRFPFFFALPHTSHGQRQKVTPLLTIGIVFDAALVQF